jgi:signal transduction histidine kinase
MSGFEVLTELRADKKTRRIPVVMITAYNENEARVKAFESGCDDFISKPFDQYELLARVKSLLRIKFLNDEIDEAREFAESVINTVREPLISLDQDLRVVAANHSFYDTFKVTPEETIGNFIYDLGNRQWDIPKLRVLFEEILPLDTVFNGYEVEHDFLDIGRKIILLNARQIFREKIGSHIILLAMEDITERKSAEDKIERLNIDLTARASDLEDANRELEAFNYTVAHDLRKPLTIVNAYCQAIRELCGDKLNEECKGYLQEAYDGTLRMNRLIDALLKFSRLAHVEPRRETVALSAMAHGVATELRLAEPGRRIEFRIADGLSADGDAALLRVVLDNLLGNAWKYTGRREEGIIEFGITEVDGNPAWFIRDNGAGFDMADADKLFIPFQRLPGAKECKGFGIGLATVERIIRRHGGRIWAEGEPGKGATFYFTLAADGVSNKI